MKTLPLILVFALFGCKTETTQKEMQFVENKVFYSGFSSGNSELVELNGEEYLCYGDYNTYKKIVLHSIKNESIVAEFNLAPIVNLNESVLAYEIISLDSAYILTKNTNKVFLINKEGNIQKEMDFNLDPKIKGKYQLSRGLSPFKFNDSTYIFPLDFRAYNKNHPIDEYLESITNPRLYKVSNIHKDSIGNSTLGLDYLYQNFTKKGDFPIEGPRFKFINDKIFFISYYSDTIYQISPNTLKVIDKFKITSQYSDIFIKPITLKENIENSRNSTENYWTNGRIMNLHYDKNKNVYFCFVNHKPKDGIWPTSIIVLDTNFNQLNEIKLDKTKYNTNGYICKEGILISNYKETLKDKDHFKKNTMALFRYE